jgi:hypothetical protein
MCLHEGSPCDPDVTACTLEVCDEGKSSCELANKPDIVTTCPDASLCNGTEICLGGECLPGGPYCPTISDCLVKSCDENGGDPLCGDPAWAFNGTLCSPTDPCLGTGTHRCIEGVCADAETPACQPEDQDESFCSYYPVCTPVGNLPFCNGPLLARDTDDPVNKSDPTDIFSRWFAVIDEATTDPLGIVRSFSTVSKNNDVTFYSGGACSGEYSGGDLVFQLDLSPGSSWRLEIATAGSTNGADLTLLLVGNPCAPSATCIESSTTYIDFTAPATGHHYAVVDGKNGNRGTGTLTLTPR